MADIEFLCPPDLHGRIPEPQPAARFLPAWCRAQPRDATIRAAAATCKQTGGSAHAREWRHRHPRQSCAMTFLFAGPLLHFC